MKRHLRHYDSRIDLWIAKILIVVISFAVLVLLIVTTW